MRIDVLNPPAPTMTARSMNIRRAHLLREIEQLPERPEPVARRVVPAMPGRRRADMPSIGRKAALACVLAAALAAIAAVLPGQMGKSRMTLIDNAIAAIGNGPMTHVLLDEGIGTRRIDFPSGKTTFARTRMELWFDPKLGLLGVSTLDGEPLQTIFAPAGQTPRAADWYRPFVTGYREQLKSGAYHVVSIGRISGQPVEWIAHKPKWVADMAGIPHEYVQEVAISRATFKPVYMRTRVDGVIKPDSVAHVITAETLPRKPSLFAHRRTSTGGFGTTPTAPATTLREARIAMSPNPVVPGTHLAGLRRSWIGLPRYLNAGNTYRSQVGGVELFYGRTDYAGKPIYHGSFISITEFPQANAEVRFQGLALFPSHAAIVNDRTATMKVLGLYVIIKAGSPDEAVAAARALGR